MDPAVYIELAEGHGWKIDRVLDTHVHADHLSRSRKLAGLTGAELRTPVSPLGDELQIRRASPVPENYERIVELNRAGELPEGDPAELAYRCAAG